MRLLPTVLMRTITVNYAMHAMSPRDDMSLPLSKVFMRTITVNYAMHASTTPDDMSLPLSKVLMRTITVNYAMHARTPRDDMSLCRSHWWPFFLMVVRAQGHSKLAAGRFRLR